MDISTVIKDVRSNASGQLFPGLPDDVQVAWSFDAGLPDPSTFPVDDLARIAGEILREDAAGPLQYGDGYMNMYYGYEGLRHILADRAREREGRNLDTSSIMLTQGGMQGITLACQAFMGSGDLYAAEAPTWGGVLMEAQRAGAELIGVPMDRDGLRVDLLEDELLRVRKQGRRVNVLYTIATFNTPTGWSMSLPRRRRLIELAEEHEFIIIEDNVYGELRYEGDPIPTLFSLDTTGFVLKVDSFSKTFAPGLRLGWVSGHPAIVRSLVARRGDLGSSQWLARIMARYLQEGHYDLHVKRVNELYRQKRDVAAGAVRKWCGQWATFEIPQGGYFLWIGLASEVDGQEVMRRALAGGVMCRPGERFFGEDEADKHKQWLRMAFSMVPIGEIERGVEVLGKAIADSIH